jgi:hypothetical protein
VPVPAYQMIGQPGPFFPYVFPGYRKLNGTPAIDLSVNLVDAIALAPLLGSFLSAVHSFSPAEARDLWVFMGLAGRAAREGSDSALSGSHGSRISRSRPSLWCLFSDCGCVLRSDGGNRQEQADRSRGAGAVVLPQFVRPSVFSKKVVLADRPSRHYEELRSNPTLEMPEMPGK